LEEFVTTDDDLFHIATTPTSESISEGIGLLAQLSELTDVPAEYLDEIKQVHNEIVGHHGHERTLRKLFRKNKRWPYMREHVRLFIKHCPCCEKMSQIRHAVHTTPFTTSSRGPMERISFDAIGELAEDEEWGYKHILVVIDNFTRWIELYPIRNTTAAEAARALLNHAGRYGHAKEWVSDRGTQFTNEIFAEMAQLMGTTHKLTIAHSKEENAIAERANKEVMRHLRALLYEAGKFDKWAQYLPMVMRIINSTVHESIGMSPAELMMPWIDLNRQLIDNVTAKEMMEGDTPMSEWSQQMLKVHQRLIHTAQQRQESIDARHKAKVPDTVTSFPVNSYVLLSYPDGAMGRKPPNKFNTQWKGPFRVVRSVGAEYDIMNLVTNKLSTVHVSRLKEFHYDPAITDPVEVAAKDYQEFKVSEILRHTGRPPRYGQMDFLVRWEGYGPEEDLWLPWRELRNNPTLHEYLFRNGMTKLIPKEHRAPYLAQEP
jgi:transposase InsO family protein